jgi:hypothetical protein
MPARYKLHLVAQFVGKASFPLLRKRVLHAV